MKSHNEYLRHILDEVDFIVTCTENMQRKDFLQDELRKRAVVRSLEIIGEAVKNLPHEFRDKHPHIDWKAMAGTRDKLIHAYFGVDYELVWDIAINEVGLLKSNIKELLSQ